MSVDVEVIVLGGCIMDFMSYADRFPNPGETLIGNDFSLGFGGKAANACIMAARMGLKTAMIAKVGTDRFGKEFIENFKVNGVITDHVTLTEVDSITSSANITVTKDGQNSIVYVHGAAAFLDGEVVKRAEALFQKAKYVIITYECLRSALLEALKLSKKYNVTTYVNAAPDNPDIKDDFYSMVDILCVNETEAERATGQPVETFDDAQKAMKILQEKGCSTVIITLGAKGAVVVSKEHPQLEHIPTNAVKVKDTTGAGDAFSGSLAYNYVRHPELDLKTQIKRACNVATITVQYPGTQKSYPIREKIPEELL